MDDQDKTIAAIIILIVVCMALVIGWVMGESIAQHELANDMCIALTYDMGVYEDGRVVCSYKSDVPLEELAPYVVPEKSGTNWQEASTL